MSLNFSEAAASSLKFALSGLRLLAVLTLFVSAIISWGSKGVICSQIVANCGPAKGRATFIASKRTALKTRIFLIFTKFVNFWGNLGIFLKPISLYHKLALA